MKNYRFLAPIVLIALFVLGVYMIGSNNVKEETQYRQYLEDARAYAAQEIEIYALQNYQNAIDMQPSMELYMEVAEFYRDTLGNRNKAVQWGETLLAKYPKNPEPYEFQLDMYLQNKDYMAFFDLYDRMENRHVRSEAADAMYHSVEYVFYEQGEYDEISIFSSNLASIRRNETWGFCNSKGKKKINTLYTYVGTFNNGMAPVVDAEGEAYYIDNDGNKVMAVNVEDVQELGVMSMADIYTVFNGREWNYYNKSGELLMGGFLEGSTFANGLAAARTEEGWKIYDVNGNARTDMVYGDVVMDEKQMAYRNERLFVRMEDAYILIDGEGNRIGTETYEDAKVFYENTYAAVKKDGKWGFIDKDGNWFSEPIYEDARSFLNGFAAVQVDGLWGFINMEKELCIPCQFTQTKDFTANGTVPVQKNQTWSVLILYKENY
ncbi:MAG: WG repeat-containing protein [Lachnospiraceae bacterium]|nr:WG repeat-containing protein [Lachnospiraceae bacterium]